MAPIRILMAKAGLDGHDRGIKVIVRALRDAGMEVIYQGLHQTPEAIVRAAEQEDPDAIGISILSGAHLTIFRRTLDLLQERGIGHIPVVGGGVIPKDDASELERMGVRKIFFPGAPIEEIVAFLRSLKDMESPDVSSCAHSASSS